LVDKETLAARLAKLREALQRLDAIAKKPRDEYLRSEVDRPLSEHYLRIALEAMLDTGNHIISAEGFRKPMQLRDIPIILAEEGVLARELSERLARAAGLRNRLVHLYAEVDYEILYSVLQTDMKDLVLFAEAVGRRFGNP
jgi:uncharacterized protein YutE (UPF0331/DUF86 family)